MRNRLRAQGTGLRANPGKRPLLVHVSHGTDGAEACPEDKTKDKSIKTKVKTELPIDRITFVL